MSNPNLPASSSRSNAETVALAVPWLKTLLHNRKALIIAGAVLTLVIILGIMLGLGVFTSRSAEVNTLAGKVETRFGETGAYRSAEVGQKLKAGDAIRTGSDGQALLVMDDGTGVRVAEDSEVSLKQIASSNASPVTHFLLNAGKVYNILPNEPPTGGAYEVETPTGVVAVRGSMLSVAYSSSAGIEATCLSGHCEVNAAGNTQPLTTGQAATVDPQQTISAAADMTSGQKYAWVPVIDEARTAGVAVDRAVQTGCTCQDVNLVCQDGTRVPYYPTCTNERQPVPLIAYIGGTYGDIQDLYVTQADGSSPLKLTNTTSQQEVPQNPRWSPDGSQIAFLARDATSTMGFAAIINPDGTGYHPLLDPSMSAYDPRWSPDGSRIMVTLGNDVNENGMAIYTVKPDGSDLVSTGVYSWYGSGYASWSPDGTQIAYWTAPMLAQDVPTLYQVFVVNLDGSDPRKIFEVTLPGQTAGLWPRWSPDQQKIAWTAAAQSGDSMLVVINADGSGSRTLVEMGAEPGNVYFDTCWLPDSQRFLTSDTKGIQKFNIDGGAPTQLIADPEAAVDGDCLSPDGTQFRYRSHLAQAAVTGDYLSVGPLMSLAYLYVTALDGSGQTLIAKAPEGVMEWVAQPWPEP